MTSTTEKRPGCINLALVSQLKVTSISIPQRTPIYGDLPQSEAKVVNHLVTYYVTSQTASHPTPSENTHICFWCCGRQTDMHTLIHAQNHQYTQLHVHQSKHRHEHTPVNEYDATVYPQFKRISRFSTTDAVLTL